MAQIAKSISLRINATEKYFEGNPIDLDLVETAALAHDLGHPPFGHNGERALNECMKSKGGFEGNAQTLRILAKLERKEREPHPKPPDEDERVGLNLTYRTLAAVLKYDRCIPICRPAGEVVKGYYASEEDLVQRIKRHVTGSTDTRGFKTIECQIMDIADDIAYSTYDLEDALKAGFVTVMSMITSLKSANTVGNVSRKTGLSRERVIESVMEIWEARLEPFPQEPDAPDPHELEVATYVHQIFENLAKEGAIRTQLTSELVDEYVAGVVVEVNDQVPSLSRVELNERLRDRVEVIKNLTYELVVNSPNLKTVEYRGSRIVEDIFKALSGPDGDRLLPDDFRSQLEDRPAEQDRIICDFIAGMTDRYALEFFGRLTSEGSIFKPL